MADEVEYLEEITLGAAEGKRPALTVEVVRSLSELDRTKLAKPPIVPPGSQISRLRHAHYNLAQLLARGMSRIDAAATSGYTPQYVALLIDTDPAFQELVAHYADDRREIFAHEVARLKVLGLTALEELQARLAETPEKWTNRELMEFAELCLTHSSERAQGIAAAPGGVVVNVSFPEIKAKVRPGVIDVTEAR